MGVLMDFNQIGKHCETKADSTLNNMKKAPVRKDRNTMRQC